MLKGSRVAVRPFELTDVEDYFAYAHLKQATLPAGMTALKSQAAALEHIRRFAREKQDLALVYRQHVVGNIGVYPRDLSPLTGDDMTREIGYILHPHFWHRGFMTEGLRLVIDDQFHNGIQAVWAGVFPENIASINLLQRLGFDFQFEVPLPRGLTPDQPRNERYYRLLPNQFEK